MHDREQRTKVLLAGVFNLILCLGVARFSYTPLLPLMQQQAGLGVAEAGWLAAINYTGYLIGALVASLIGDVALKHRLYRLGMFISVVSTLLMGVSNDVAVWAVSRFLAGLGSAAGLVLGSGLVLNWLIRHNHRSELGIQFVGVGAGIAACSALVEWLTPMLTWREQWFALAGIGMCLAIPALRWLPRPDATGLTAAGQEMVDQPPTTAFLWVFMAAYFCAGVGYVVSATFIVAIVNNLPSLAGSGNLAFFAIGIGAAPAGIAWDLVARRFGALNALIMAAVAQTVGILLPVLHGGLALTIAGAVLFGATFVGMVSLVMNIAGRFYPTRPAMMMGRMTLAYGIAQIGAPAITGSLAAYFGSYEVGLYLAAGAMVVGTGLLLILKRLESEAARGRP